MPNGLITLVREYPGLFAVMAVVGVAGVATMFLDYRGQKKQTDEQILAARQREAIKKANEWYERDEPRLHWWT